MSATASSTSLDKKELTEGANGTRLQTVGGSEVDVAAHLVAGKNVTFTPEEAARVRYVVLDCRDCANVHRTDSRSP